MVRLKVLLHEGKAGVAFTVYFFDFVILVHLFGLCILMVGIELLPNEWCNNHMMRIAEDIVTSGDAGHSRTQVLLHAVCRNGGQNHHIAHKKHLVFQILKSSA